MYAKLFDEWNIVKKTIDGTMHRPPFFKERDIWWRAFGVNVGSETCGKNMYFRRPVLIVKKMSRSSFVGVPLSSRFRDGSWYITFSHSDGIINTANLSQIRAIDYRRLDKKIGSIGTDTFRDGCIGLRKLLGL